MVTVWQPNMAAAPTEDD